MAPPMQHEKQLRASGSRRKVTVAERRRDFEDLDALVYQRDRKVTKAFNEKSTTAKPKPLPPQTKPVLPFDKIDPKTFLIDPNTATERAPSRRPSRPKSRRYSKASKASRRSILLRSRSVGGGDGYDSDLLEHTDDEDNIFHAPYNMVCFGSDGKEGFYLEPRSQSDSAQHLRSSPPEESLADSPQWSSRAPLPPRQPWSARKSPFPPTTTTVQMPSRIQVNQKACKRSLLRWMANNMCKTPFVKHH